MTYRASAMLLLVLLTGCSSKRYETGYADGRHAAATEIATHYQALPAAPTLLPAEALSACGVSEEQSHYATIFVPGGLQHGMWLPAQHVHVVIHRQAAPRYCGARP